MTEPSEHARRAAERLFEDRAFATRLNRESFVMCYADIIQSAIDAATAELRADKARIDALEANHFIHAIANKSQPSAFYTRGFLAFEGETFREALDKDAAFHPEQEKKE